MNTARIVVLAIAIGAGGIAAYLASGSDDKPAPAQPVAQLQTVDILVAKSDIGLGQSVKPDDLQWQTWPAATASSSFISRASKADAIKEITGSIARSPFIAGEPIREQKLVKADGSGFMAAILPAGYRAISTEISPETGAGGFILPNDRVDVLLTKRDKNPDGKGAGRRQLGDHPHQCSRSRDRPGAEGKRRHQRIGRQDGHARTEARADRDARARSRQSGTLTLALRSIADINDGREAGRTTIQQARRKPQRHSLRRCQPADDAEVTERTHDMKCREIQPMMRTFIVRALSFSAVAALTLNPALTPVVASDYRTAAPVTTDGQMNARFVSLGIGKSIVIDLPREIKDVLVADPKVANAVVRSTQRAYIIGAAVGQTNIVFFDSTGAQIAAYDIAVKRDLNGVRAALKQSLPNSDILIEGVGDGVVLSGTAASPIEAQQAADIAARLVGGNEKVVNSIAVRGRDQVMLKVTVAEVTRSIIKQLGIDLTANLNYGTAVVNFNNSNPFTALGRPLVVEQRDADIVRRHSVSDGYAPRDGERRRRSHAGRAQSDRDLGRIRDLHCRRRISRSRRLFLRSGHARLYDPDLVQEVRHFAQLHARGDDRRPDQPSRHDGSVGTVERQLDHADAGPRRQLDELADHSLDQDPPRGNHAGNSFGRLDGHGRPDCGADQAGHQRPPRSVATAGSRHAVPQPRLRQQPDRTDGSGHALCGARGGAEGPVAAR